MATRKKITKAKRTNKKVKQTKADALLAGPGSCDAFVRQFMGLSKYVIATSLP